MQLGSRCCHRLPCRRTSIRSHQPKLMPRFLVSAARYARAVRRRRQVSRFRSTPRVRRPMESCALLGSTVLRRSFASHRSGRTTRRHFVHLGLLHLKDSKIPEMSHFAPFGSSCDVPRFATVPVEPPEGISPFPACSARPARKPPWHRSRSARFGPKAHQNIPGRSSGPGAIIRRVSAFPATGGLRRNDAEASRLRSSPRCPSLLPGCPARRAAFRCDPRSFGPKASCPRFGTSVCFVRHSRLHAPVERSGGCRSYFETVVLTLRIGRPFRRPSP